MVDGNYQNLGVNLKTYFTPLETGRYEATVLSCPHDRLTFSRKHSGLLLILWSNSIIYL